MDDISGLPPAVAIESRNTVRNSRSTVGTTTEVYDYMRLLFAKIGRIFCPECSREVRHRSPGDIAEELLSRHGGERVLITFPPGNLNLTPAELLSNGFTRIIKDGEVMEVEGLPKIPAGAEIVLDRLQLDKKSRTRLVGSLELAFEESRRVNVRIIDGETLRFSADLECPECHMRFNEPTPLLFSFNSPQGACPECKGFGNILGLDPDLVIPNPDKSLSQGAIEPLTKPSLKPQMRKLLHFAEERGIYTDKPYASLPAKEKELIFEGGAGFPGVRGYFRRLEEKNYKMHVRVFLSKYRSAFTCDACLGSRLVKEALWVRVGGMNIYELSLLPIDILREFFDGLELSDFESSIAHEILKQIKSRLDFLVKVGLEYLTLARLSRTLSGGEAQRVNLACQLGATLTETLYIMDEPSIGLHPRDVDRLVSLIKELRDRDNTV
ncbi:MAG: excinuclease ABC subunit A, partial [Candidatus Dadabacteria bacterium]